MRLALVLFILGVIAVMVGLIGGGESLGGFEPGLVIGGLISAAFAALLLKPLRDTFRGDGLGSLQAAAFWLLVLLLLVAGYAYRFELSDVANRVVGVVVPGATLTGRGGEVVISRRPDGSFLVRGQANGRDLRLIFDTGASTVVLTAEDAARLGIRPSDLEYSVTVSTANGRTQAAPVIIGQLVVGDITARDVRGLVARPGALGVNLLGMSFLERLSSYEVRGDQLILRGRGL
jgi:aspartyl protease family protein